MTTPGKFRHLTRTTTEAGHFIILAIDHRRDLLQGMQTAQSEPMTEAGSAQFKREVVTALLPAGASAVLLDPQVGIARGLADGWLPAEYGLLVPLEETDYTVHPSQRAYKPIPGWSARAIKRIGGDGVKLLIYYHPEAKDAALQREIVERTVEECAADDIPLYLEPIAFSPDPAKALSSAELTDVVVDSARLFSGMGIDVLKSEFPASAAGVDEAAWRAALRRLDEASTVPWALLSAGVSYDIFRQQTVLACAAGASGVIVGRALWAEAVPMPADQRAAWLEDTGKARMADLSAICAASARSFRERTAAPDPFGPSWTVAP